MISRESPKRSGPPAEPWWPCVPEPPVAFCLPPHKSSFLSAEKGAQLPRGQALAQVRSKRSRSVRNAVRTHRRRQRCSCPGPLSSPHVPSVSQSPLGGRGLLGLALLLPRLDCSHLPSSAHPSRPRSDDSVWCEPSPRALGHCLCISGPSAGPGTAKGSAVFVE